MGYRLRRSRGSRGAGLRTIGQQLPALPEAPSLGDGDRRSQRKPILTIGIAPSETIELQFNAKIPGPSVTIDGVEMKFRYGDYFRADPSTGYETLIYDCMIGDATLFWSGLYPEALRRLRHSGPHDDLGDYREAGRRAYWLVSTLEPDDAAAWFEPITLLSALAMAIGLGLWIQIMGGLTPWLVALGGIALGGVVYLAGVVILKVPEIRFAFSALNRRVRRA